MKAYKMIVTMALLLGLLIGCAVSVGAEETDWSQVDWSQVDFTQVDWNQIDWRSIDVKTMLRELYDFMRDSDRWDLFFQDLDTWLRDEAELFEVFRVYSGTDGALSESVSGVLYDRFKEDPYGFIQALTGEDAFLQEQLIFAVCYYGDYFPEEFAAVLGSVQLPATATDVEMTVWAKILQVAETNYNVVPTGDGIGVPAALMMFGAVGLVIVLCKRKQFAV